MIWCEKVIGNNFIIVFRGTCTFLCKLGRPCWLWRRPLLLFRQNDVCVPHRRGAVGTMGLRCTVVGFVPLCVPLTYRMAAGTHSVVAGRWRSGTCTDQDKEPLIVLLSFYHSDVASIHPCTFYFLCAAAHIGPSNQRASARLTPLDISVDMLYVISGQFHFNALPSFCRAAKSIQSQIQIVWDCVGLQSGVEY